MNAQAEQKMPNRMWMWLKPRITGRSVTLFLVVAYLLFEWCRVAHADPTEVVYCLKRQDNSLEKACLESKKLKIPGTYRPSISGLLPWGGPENLKLEVVYPSMQPWHTVPLWERWSTHKIAIDMRGFTRDYSAAEGLRIFTSPPSRFVHMSEPLYGLDSWIQEDSWIGQLLLPIEPLPRLFMRCAYNGNPKDDAQGGCTTDTLVLLNEFPDASQGKGMSVYYQHSRLLIPAWADVHAKVQALIQSFVVNP